VKARLATGNIVRQNVRLVMSMRFRILNRSTRIVAPKRKTDIAVVDHAVRRVGINHDRIEASAGPSSLARGYAPEFSMADCIGILRFHKWNIAIVTVVRMDPNGSREGAPDDRLRESNPSRLAALRKRFAFVAGNDAMG
jgi:hypothetical protein